HASRSESDPWQRLTGWRHGRSAPIRRELDVPGRGRVEVRVTPVAGRSAWSLELPDAESPRTVEVAAEHSIGHGVDLLRVTIDGRVFHVATAAKASTTFLASGGETWAVSEVSQRGAGGGGESHADGGVRSPMPGTVIALSVAPGEVVARGQAVAIVEAMKMEHTLTAPFDGEVSAVHVTAGSSVALDQLLVEVQRRE
ncbi:MAG TPA: biotin/lipoyl-containing protein, partial [Ilumatobacter sp.]|nr:biotin/lipoyl-containing protein [Ilumatobacter sp.]